MFVRRYWTMDKTNQSIIKEDKAFPVKKENENIKGNQSNMVISPEAKMLFLQNKMKKGNLKYRKFNEKIKALGHKSVWMKKIDQNINKEENLEGIWECLRSKQK